MACIVMAYTAMARGTCPHMATGGIGHLVAGYAEVAGLEARPADLVVAHRRELAGDRLLARRARCAVACVSAVYRHRRRQT